MPTPVLLLIILAVPWVAAALFALNRGRRRGIRERWTRAATAHLPEPEAADGFEEARRESFPALTGVLARFGWYRRIEMLLQRMDLPLSPGEYAACILTLWIAAPVTAWALDQPAIIILGVFILAVGAPRVLFSFRIGWRKRQFAQQLPDALDMISSSLRVGHGFQRALQLVSSQGQEPLATEFRRVLSEVTLGSPVDAALQRAAERVESKELDLLANVVGIQMQIGGNLAEIIDRVGETIREREELQNEIKSLTAEGKMTAVICLAMPPLMGLFEAWVNPEYMAPLLKTTIGLSLLGGMAFLQILGAVFIKRMMKLE